MTEIYVMTRPTISRHKNAKGTPPICGFCGLPIQEGDLCIRRLHGRRDRRTEYVHAKCDEKGGFNHVEM
jgi:hypothetical protein